MVSRLMKSKSASASATAEHAAGAAVASIDLDDVSALLEKSGSIWKQGAEKVIGTMNQTAAAFALDRRDDSMAEDAGALNIAGGSGGDEALDSQLRQRAEGKLGAKWMRKVLRYKGQDAGASEDVLQQLLRDNFTERVDAKENSTGVGSSPGLCIEDLLKDMSGDFVAEMTSFAAKQLEGIDTKQFIGPFAKELAEIEEKISAVDAEHERMKKEAGVLENMHAIVSDCARGGAF
jgi:hypothetical protein